MRDHIFEKVETITIQKKIWFITKYRHEHKLVMLLKVMKLSKSTYFENLNRKTSRHGARKQGICSQIQTIYNESNQVYGARKIAQILQKSGVKITTRTISNYMQELQIRSIRSQKSYKSRPKSNDQDSCVNYLKDVTVTTVNTHVCTDMTYIYTILDGWVYQLTFMDLMTRKILHSEVSATMDDEFVSSNTSKLLERYPTIKMIHADRGSQYTSKRFRKLLEEQGVVASYSAPGYPYDNAKIESYHASLKREKLYRFRIMNLAHAKKLVFEYNYGFYNTRRIHESIDYLTPNQFERQLLIAN